MKTCPFLFIFFIVMIQLKAQPYESIFGESSTSWNIYEEIADAGRTDSIYITSDTSFNGFNYKYFTDTYEYKRGYLREDTLTGKVWFYSINAEVEFLAMDMNLSIADTFFVNPYAGSEFYAIVDSVFIQDGRKYIHFNYPLLYAEDSLEFIEGVGPNAGLIFQETDSYAVYSHLLCAQKDHIETYQNSIYEGICMYNWTAIKTVLQQPLVCRVYPDPFSDRATISFNNPQKNVFTCFIYNSAMQLMSVSADIIDDHLIIERNDLFPGLYFISLFNAKGSRISGTFIVL